MDHSPKRRSFTSFVLCALSVCNSSSMALLLSVAALSSALWAHPILYTYTRDYFLPSAVAAFSNFTAGTTVYSTPYSYSQGGCRDRVFTKRGRSALYTKVKLYRTLCLVTHNKVVYERLKMAPIQ